MLARLENVQFEIGIGIEIMRLLVEEEKCATAKDHQKPPRSRQGKLDESPFCKLEKRPDAKGKKRPASHRANQEGQIGNGAEIFDLFGE